MKKYHQHNIPRGFLRRRRRLAAILIDLWEAPGWLMSELVQTRRGLTSASYFRSTRKNRLAQCRPTRLKRAVSSGHDRQFRPGGL